MTFSFSPMTQQTAECIANHWKYDGIYSFYDSDADEEDYNEFISADKRSPNFYEAHHGNELVGFVVFDTECDEAIDIGLGLKPELTGQKLGAEFMKSILSFAREHFSVSVITLSVASFNKRAISVYEKAGFTYVCSFLQETNGGTYEFIKMQLIL